MSKDNLHKKCNKCKKGTYEEWCLECDWYGIPLRCTNCKDSIERYNK